MLSLINVISHLNYHMTKVTRYLIKYCKKYISALKSLNHYIAKNLRKLENALFLDLQYH